MNKILILISIIFLAASCPDCPPHDPTICDTTIVHDTLIVHDTMLINWVDSIKWTFKDTTIVNWIDTIWCDTLVNWDTIIIPQPIPVPIPCPCDTSCPDPGEGVLFQSDFENTTIVQTGNNGEPFRINGFDEFYSVYGIGSFIFNISPPEYTLAAIRPDPINPANKCMYGEVIADDPNEGGTSRFQTSLRTDADLDVIHFSYDVFWSEDIRSLETRTSKIDWFSVVELWEQHNPNLDGDVSGQCRWNMGFFKDASGPLYWNLHMELMQPASVRFDTYWTAENRSIPIPLGKWINLDFRFERGQQGRITVKLDGQILFDVIRPTEYPANSSNITPLPIWAINTMKLYTSMTNVNIIKNSGGRLYAYYDNFKWYED